MDCKHEHVCGLCGRIETTELTCLPPGWWSLTTTVDGVKKVATTCPNHKDQSVRLGPGETLHSPYGFPGECTFGLASAAR